MREITGSLAEFPVKWVDGEWVDGEWVDGEWVDGEWVVPVEPDDLAQRRQARTAG